MNFDIIFSMEYQSFFLIIKEYKIIDNHFCVPNTFGTAGYVQIKKEGDNYQLIIQISNYKNKSGLVIVSRNETYSYQISSATTKIIIKDKLYPDDICVFMQDISLFASSLNSSKIEEKYKSILIKNNPQKNIFNKIFGEVYDTYFYDSIRSKINKLFALGLPCDIQEFGKARWVKLSVYGQEKYIGILYRGNSVYALAFGQKISDDVKKGKNIYNLGGTNYKFKFMSASDGKFLQFSNGNLC